MRCPICQRPVKKDDPFMPFCTERCKLIDLANWADEKYKIAADPIHENNMDEEEG